jgi:putative ABC transport system substrate-binding protein
LPDAFKELWRQIDCFLIIPDSRVYSAKSVEYLLVEAFRKTIPVIGLSSSYTKAGALISFECDYEDLGEQAAEIALKILNGEDPAKIKYLGPKKINFSLNLLAAQRLDIKISSDVIKEAKEVFGE